MTFEKRPCLAKQRLTQETLLAMLIGQPSFSFFAGIDRDKWIINSFNPKTREACVTISTDSGTRDVTVQVPELVAKF